MIITRTIKEISKHVTDWKKQGESLGLVPTMGMLHKAHGSLVQEARKMSDRVIVSLFVNPTQFNDPQDFTSYPKDDEYDIAFLRDKGCDLAFLPEPEEMYPKGFSTEISICGLADPLCGKYRPGHFLGVAQVVLKLINITKADFAFFGIKDWQQLMTVKRMIIDLNLPIDIVGCETVREESGLAISSRNLRLTNSEKKVAPSLYRILRQSTSNILDGNDIKKVCKTAIAELLRSGFDSVDYFEPRNSLTLESIDILPDNEAVRLFASATLGAVRLIDNIPIKA